MILAGAENLWDLAALAITSVLSASSVIGVQWLKSWYRGRGQVATIEQAYLTKHDQLLDRQMKDEESARAQADKWLEKYLDSNATIIRLQEELGKAKDEASACRRESDEMRKTIDALNADRGALRQRVSELEAQVKELAIQVEELRAARG